MLFPATHEIRNMYGMWKVGKQKEKKNDLKISVPSILYCPYGMLHRALDIIA